MTQLHTLRSKRVLVVGVGGLGSPAAIALAASGVGTIGLADDDVVERSNLHRQILFEDADVGLPKIDVAARALATWRATHAPTLPPLDVVRHRTRLLPDNARAIVRQYDVVVEGSDNFATKFMTADACSLERVAVVHGSAVRWHGTALAVSGAGKPCYRCVFEDIPHEQVLNCAEAGVMGPVVGVIGAIQADLALRIVLGEPAYGDLVTFDGKTRRHRRHRLAARSDCPLCGRPSIEAGIMSVDEARYQSPASDVSLGDVSN